MSNFLAKAYPVIGQGLSLIYSPGAQAAVGYLLLLSAESLAPNFDIFSLSVYVLSKTV